MYTRIHHWSYPEPDASSPHLPTQFPKIHSHSILPSMSRSLEWSHLLRFSNQNFVCISHLTHACCMTFPSHLPCLDCPNSCENLKSLINEACALCTFFLFLRISLKFDKSFSEVEFVFGWHEATFSVGPQHLVLEMKSTSQYALILCSITLCTEHVRTSTHREYRYLLKAVLYCCKGCVCGLHVEVTDIKIPWK